MEKEILKMNYEELRIEVAMLRERCSQLEIRLAKANQYPQTPLEWQTGDTIECNGSWILRKVVC